MICKKDIIENDNMVFQSNCKLFQIFCVFKYSGFERIGGMNKTKNGK